MFKIVHMFSRWVMFLIIFMNRKQFLHGSLPKFSINVYDMRGHGAKMNWLIWIECVFKKTFQRRAPSIRLRAIVKNE